MDGIIVCSTQGCCEDRKKVYVCKNTLSCIAVLVIIFIILKNVGTCKYVTYLKMHTIRNKLHFKIYIIVVKNMYGMGIILCKILYCYF